VQRLPLLVLAGSLVFAASAAGQAQPTADSRPPLIAGYRVGQLWSQARPAAPCLVLGRTRTCGFENGQAMFRDDTLTHVSVTPDTPGDFTNVDVGWRAIRAQAVRTLQAAPDSVVVRRDSVARDTRLHRRISRVTAYWSRRAARPGWVGKAEVTCERFLVEDATLPLCFANIQVELVRGP
jgi:hypothetical protein